MAVKDGRKYLRQAIDSVLGQTFGDFEFIIIDDGSADDSRPIIENYADARIRLLVNRDHPGLSASLNAGLNAARGEYIARMDADDVCLPDRLEKQIHFLDQHPHIVVLGTGIRLIDEQDKPIQDVQLPADNDLIKWQLCFLNPIAHPSAMMRAAAVRQVGGYDAELVHAQDYDLWWRLSAGNRLANLSDILMLLRQHPGQVSQAHRSEQFECGIKIIQKHLSSLLGHVIAEDVIRNVWTQRGPALEDALRSGRLLLEYFHKTSAGMRSGRAKNEMTQDAASKIRAIISPFLKKPKTWYLLWRIFLMNPLLTLRFLADRVRLR
ncbi:MAG: glycosyltransferase [candidate division Zixibacteria bacterium]|nr:glycosyltransferase [candidate division Zixibacteria bacterium]